MSGHSKWHSIKHKKAATDAKRGNLFTKLGREITVAARSGGGDIEFNPGLRTAVANAKAANMPNDNITRAIKRGTGELEGVNYEEISYEGYGPNGVAIIVRTLTDNKNRTVADIRHLFGKYNGSLGETGCVGYLFSRTGYIALEKSAAEEDALMEVALEAGAEDIREAGEMWEVLTPTDALDAVREAIEKANLPIEQAEVTMLPSTTVDITEEKAANSILKFMEAVEDHDDVQNVYSNFDISEEVLAALDSE